MLIEEIGECCGKKSKNKKEKKGERTVLHFEGLVGEQKKPQVRLSRTALFSH